MENKKMEKTEEKILRQEEFRVDCPRRIVVGDPSYFEEFSGERLKRLTANYAPPRFFEARVILTEVEFAEFPGEKVCGLSVYMAPKETIETYAEGMMYEGQEISTKEIGVDTARYLIIVDGQNDTVHTGGDGYRGRCEEDGRKIEKKKTIQIKSFIVNLGKSVYNGKKKRTLSRFMCQLIEKNPSVMSS